MSDIELTFNEKVKLFGQQSGTFFSQAEGFFNTDDMRKYRWFQPVKSVKEFFYKGICIATAPVAHALFLIEMALLSVFMLLKSLADLVTLDLQTAKSSATMAASDFMSVFILAFFVIASPFANLIDLAGSLIASACGASAKTAEEPAPPFPAV